MENILKSIEILKDDYHNFTQHPNKIILPIGNKTMKNFMEYLDEEIIHYSRICKTSNRICDLISEYNSIRLIVENNTIRLVIYDTDYVKQRVVFNSTLGNVTLKELYNICKLNDTLITTDKSKVYKLGDYDNLQSITLDIRANKLSPELDYMILAITLKEV